MNQMLTILTLTLARLKTISSVTCAGKIAYIGTEGGNIYTLDIDAFTISDSVIYSEAVTEGWVRAS